MAEVDVVVVGAGPAGLATSACLNRLNISHIVLEREDCSASLWKKRSYDRLKLHLAKQFCELPHLPFPKDAPKFVSRRQFIHYLDTYVSHFNINPRYHRAVESAFYDVVAGKWCVVVNNTQLGVQETYYGKFLVAATGENSEGHVPQLQGLSSFQGEAIHSSMYQNGTKYCDKDVLVVGAGNSGLEIAYDLSNSGANTSIVVRSPTHILTKEIVFIGMVLLSYLPVKYVDWIVLFLTRLTFGNLAKFGIQKPAEGPFLFKNQKGQTPIIDVGCVPKIKTGEIKVLPSINSIEGNEVQFENGYIKHYDAIIFATGYKSTVLKWLKDDNKMFNDDGMPKNTFPNHWNLGNNLYCAGFSKRGLFAISSDAKNIADDIRFSLSH